MLGVHVCVFHRHQQTATPPGHALDANALLRGDLGSIEGRGGIKAIEGRGGIKESKEKQREVTEVTEVTKVTEVTQATQVTEVTQATQVTEERVTREVETEGAYISEYPNKQSYPHAEMIHRG